MNRQRSRMLLPALLLWSGSTLASQGNDDEWRFRVLLDDDSIGFHHFRLQHGDEGTRLTTEARFDVTFLKIPLFTYQHENTELWNENCLQQITSETDQNGDLFTVNGTRTEQGFMVSRQNGEATLPGCISTFAYWDKSFLERDRLLNSQTGEYVDVSVDYLGDSPLAVGDERVPARRYRLTAEDKVIDLWYSLADRWLALETVTTTGSVLRYVSDKP